MISHNVIVAIKHVDKKRQMANCTVFQMISWMWKKSPNSMNSSNILAQKIKQSYGRINNIATIITFGKHIPMTQAVAGFMLVFYRDTPVSVLQGYTTNMSFSKGLKPSNIAMFIPCIQFLCIDQICGMKAGNSI